MLITNLLTSTLVFIAISSGFERASAECCPCGAIYNLCLDGTKCTPFCAHGKWWVLPIDFTPYIIWTVFAVTCLAVTAMAAAGSPNNLKNKWARCTIIASRCTSKYLLLPHWDTYAKCLLMSARPDDESRSVTEIYTSFGDRKTLIRIS
jgi:hypothetical protein